MDLDGQYASAMFADRWTVLGLRLMPLTIGQATLLHRVGSPAAESSRVDGLSLGDLVVGAWVCSRPHDQARMDRWMTAVRLSMLGWRWGWRGWWLQRARFAAYLNDSWKGPRLWKREDEGRPANVPTVQMLKLHRMARLGASEAEALLTPVRVALWDLAAMIEGEEPGLILGSAEIEALDAARSAAEAGADAVAVGKGTEEPEEDSKGTRVQGGDEKQEEQQAQKDVAGNLDQGDALGRVHGAEVAR